MRKHKLNTVLKSDIDLTQFANSRVFIRAIGNDEYRITSKLKFYSCELRTWAFDFIAKLKPYSYAKGNCSAPYGIFFNHLNNVGALTH